MSEIEVAETSRPWADVISVEDEKRYAAAGFGNPTGMGKRPALLIIDVQYRTVGDTPKPFYESLEDYRTSCGDVGWDAVGNIALLLGAFRARGLPVLYPHVAPKKSYDAGRLGAKIPAIMDIPSKGYEFVAEVAPVEGDVLVPKNHPSAFFGTPLISYLIDAQVDTLIVTGCTTSGCVRSTVIDAFSHNFRTVVPHDAVYDRIPAVHQANLFDMAQKYADVLTTEELVKSIAGSTEIEDRQR